MNIRSIACFYDPGSSQADRHLDLLAETAARLKDALSEAGFPVQTTRLATSPFPLLTPSCCDHSAVNLAQTLEQQARAHHFDYLSLGPALPDFPDSYRLVPSILQGTKIVFCAGVIASRDRGIHLPSVRACGEIITMAAAIEPDGFANLRFTALANVPAGGPFFPAAFHTPGGPPAVALALEAAGLVEQAFNASASLAEARQRMLDHFNRQAQQIKALARPLIEAAGVHFAGLDFSPAPHPDGLSLGAGIEALGAGPLGSSGSLAAAAFVADGLTRGEWSRAGFNGLMLPVLEDSRLAERAAGGTLTIKDLLLYSAVCGTGLDTVPLPGSSSPEQLSALLLDVAALSLRLNKPLTARLMPIPGKQAGDPTRFTFSYFANSKVMDLPAGGVHGLLSGDEWVNLLPRRQ